MKVFIQVYDRCKYDEKSKVVAEEEKIIEGFEVKEISDEEMCDNGYNDFDPYHEVRVNIIKPHAVYFIIIDFFHFKSINVIFNLGNFLAVLRPDRNNSIWKNKTRQTGFYGLTKIMTSK